MLFKSLIINPGFIAVRGEASCHRRDVWGRSRPGMRHRERAGADAGGELEEAGLSSKTSHGAKGQLRHSSTAVGRP